MSIHNYPFVSLANSLLVLRVAVAIFFMAHAVVRVVTDTIPLFALFLTNKGIPFSFAVVWLITVYELGAGLLMALGHWVRLMTVGFQAIAGGGIVLIHANLGWFVGEHGIGGMEYSLCLMVALLVIAASDVESGKSSTH
ncbi:MAG: DoxX family protein [Usitatibacteraceae bacterium]